MSDNDDQAKSSVSNNIYWPKMPKVPSPDWDGAACIGEDPELFFPTGAGGPGFQQIEAAATVCRRCPIQADCYQYAIATKQEYGVWGGYYADELRARRRRETRAKQTS